MNDVVSSQSLEGPPRRPARCLKLAVVIALCVGGLTSVAYHELRTSATQSWLLSRYAASLSYAIEPGLSPSIAFPRGGPFDAQRGYSRLADFSQRLASAGYTVAEQARQSAGTIRFVRWCVTPLYREPAKKESALKKAREVIAVGEIIGSNPSPATPKDDGVAAIRPANPFHLPRNYPEIRFACSAPARGALGGRGGGDVVNGVRAKPSESSAQKKATA